MIAGELNRLREVLHEAGLTGGALAAGKVVEQRAREPRVGLRLKSRHLHCATQQAASIGVGADLQRGRRSIAGRADGARDVTLETPVAAWLSRWERATPLIVAVDDAKRCGSRLRARRRPAPARPGLTGLSYGPQGRSTTPG